LAFQGSPLKMKVVMKKSIKFNKAEEMKKGSRKYGSFGK
jgi:hypothetical protein